MDGSRLVAFLLVALGATCCHRATPEPETSPPAQVPKRAVPETRVYPVKVLLVAFESVPRRGCCVMPSPPLMKMKDLIVKLESLESRNKPEGARVGKVEGPAVAMADDLKTKVEEDLARLGDSACKPCTPSIPSRPAIYEDPGVALVAHLRSKLAAETRPGAPVELAVRESTLEARGDPAGLAAIERALADLRGDGGAGNR